MKKSLFGPAEPGRGSISQTCHCTARAPTPARAVRSAPHRKKQRERARPGVGNAVSPFRSKGGGGARSPRHTRQPLDIRGARLAGGSLGIHHRSPSKLCPWSRLPFANNLCESVGAQSRHLELKGGTSALVAPQSQGVGGAQLTSPLPPRSKRPAQIHSTGCPGKEK
eukprot:gene25092-biopygen8992